MSRISFVRLTIVIAAGQMDRIAARQRCLRSLWQGRQVLCFMQTAAGDLDITQDPNLTGRQLSQRFPSTPTTSENAEDAQIDIVVFGKDLH